MIDLNQHKEGITKLTIATFSDSAAPKMGLAGWFPKVTSIEKEVAIEVERNRQLIAVDVKRCTDANLNVFGLYSEKTFIPPMFNEKFDFTQCRRYDVTFGQRTNPSRVDSANMVSEANRNLLSLRYKIMRSIEKMRSEVLQTGIVNLKNGDSIDFKRKADSIKVLTGAAKWDQTTSNPMADIALGCTFLREEGLSVGNTVNVLFGQAAYNAFISNVDVQKQSDFRRINRIDIGMPQFDNATGITFGGQFATNDSILNIWTYNDFYELPNGNKQKYIDTNNVVLLPEDFVGKTSYAGIPALFNEGVNGGQFIAPVEADFYVQNYVDPKVKSWFFEIASAPLPIPVSIDRLYTIKVL